MSYARNLLSRGEEVVFESRQHWLAVLGQTWLFVIGRDPGHGGADLGHQQHLGSIDGGVQVVSLVLLIVSLAFLAIKIWAWRNQEYLITNRRVIKSEGIFNKQMGDSSLEKVNDARLTQSWLGRIFDYGHLDIMTASEMAETGMVNDFPMLAEPVKFKVAMLNQKERLEFPDLAPAASPTPGSAAARCSGPSRWRRALAPPGVRGAGRSARRCPRPTRRRRGSRCRCGGRRWVRRRRSQAGEPGRAARQGPDHPRGVRREEARAPGALLGGAGPPGRTARRALRSGARAPHRRGRGGHSSEAGR